jgi:non-specific serine/threonine protein kinase/serine/threonine-protein kinase
MDSDDRHGEETSELSSDQWRRLRDLFGDVQEMPESERKAFLDRELEGEPALRAELDSFLASAKTMGAFLAPREHVGARAAAFPAFGEMIGPYRLVELLGEGGFGIVYLAEQEKPIRRRVALKLIKPGMDTRQVIARFETERQALAMMDHPSIAQVFDAGETEAGRPFFAMEYVPGISITAFCDQERIRTRDRLELFLDVCDAVQHAHQRGVIHRDLKPSNVLVARRDGIPVLKVIDFGIVKAMGTSIDERSFVTREGMVLGTIGYMSPEQSGAIQAEVDTRSDIYSLGVMLYELLAGEMPFDRVRLKRADWSEALRIIREEDPPSLTSRLMRGERATSSSETKGRSGRVAEIASLRAADERSLLRELKGELEWITLRALEKEPDRRYASASELSADIRRHLANEPVLARAPSTAYRVGKFARRHRVGVAAAALVSFAIVAGGITSTVGFTRAVRAERAARREAETARQISDYMVGLFRSSAPDRARGETITAHTLLEEGTLQIRNTVTDDPQVRARLLTTLGSAHLNLALDDEGLALLREALAVSDSAKTRDPMQVANQLYELAHGLRMVGRWQDEEIGVLMDRALAILHESGDKHHHLLPSCLRVKAEWLDARHESARADSFITVAISLAEAASSPDTLELIRAYGARGRIAGGRARYDDRERFYRHALALSESSGQFPSWSISLHQNLASVYAERGDPAKAVSHAEQGVRLARKIYPPDHPSIATALNGEVEALSSQGQYEKAIAVSEEKLRILRKSGRALSCASTLETMGMLYLATGQADLAVPFSEEAWNIWRENVGAENFRTTVGLLNLARSQAGAMQTARAESSFKAAIDVLDRMDPKGYFNGVAYCSYASLCRDTGRLQRADTLYTHAEAILDSSSAEVRPYIAECLIDHGYLRSRQGRHSEAEAMIASGFQLRRRDRAEEGRDCGPLYLTWAAARVCAGDAAGAIEKLRQASSLGMTDKDAARYPELASLRSRPEYPRKRSL